MWRLCGIVTSILNIQLLCILQIDCSMKISSKVVKSCHYHTIIVCLNMKMSFQLQRYILLRKFYVIKLL